MNKNPHILLGFCVLFVCSLACNLPTYQTSLQSTSETIELQDALTAPVVDDRPGVMEYLGRPDAFDISVVEVEGVEVRLESWRYFQYGTRVDFVDGEAVWTIDIDLMPEGTIFAAWYDPLDFTTGMSREEAYQLIVDSSPANAPPTFLDLSIGGEDLVGGGSLIGDQIIIGLYEDRVVYVETVALVPEGGQ